MTEAVSEAETGSAVSDSTEPSGKVEMEPCLAGLVMEWGCAHAPALCPGPSLCLQRLSPPSADSAALCERPQARGSTVSTVFTFISAWRPLLVSAFFPTSVGSGLVSVILGHRASSWACTELYCHGNRRLQPLLIQGLAQGNGFSPRQYSGTVGVV